MTGSSFTEEMTVAQIVLNHSECAGVFRRYRIDYCCKGEQPLAQACRQRGAEPGEVLAALEQAVSERSASPGIDPRDLSTDVLVMHVVHRYHRALRDALPFAVTLSKKVARVHGEHNPKLLALRDAVAAYAEAMIPHMDQEEEVLFPALTAPKPDGALVQRELATMHADHLAVSRIVEAIRAAADDFALPDWACTSYTTLFRELEAMEKELFAHVHLENHVLMPRFATKAA
jgi:regulator of cell morphogenesis and NO signaling